MDKRVVATDVPSVMLTDNAEILGQLIKAKRTQLAMKLVDCASLCGIGINTLSRLEMAMRTVPCRQRSRC